MTDQPTSLTATVTDTGTDGLVPPGAESYEHDEETGDTTYEITKLAMFLQENFPGEMSRSNRQAPEGVVDVAIRIIQGLSASAPLSVLERCEEDYCNRPKGHVGDCGWVHNG